MNLTPEQKAVERKFPGGDQFRDAPGILKSRLRKTLPPERTTHIFATENSKIPEARFSEPEMVRPDGGNPETYQGGRDCRYSLQSVFRFR